MRTICHLFVGLFVANVVFFRIRDALQKGGFEIPLILLAHLIGPDSCVPVVSQAVATGLLKAFRKATGLSS